MSRFRSKTALAILITVIAFTIAYEVPAQAADPGSVSSSSSGLAGSSPNPSASETYLQQILANVNNLPIYLTQLTVMALSWLAPDNSNTTAALQNSFTTLFNQKLQNVQTQLASQQKFLSDFLGNPTSQTNPNANDITYPTLLNQPYFNPDPRSNVDPAYNYTQYAAGLNMRHSKPLPNWVPDKQHPGIAMYTNYYNTTSAVQTYNGYILSELYADAQNKNLPKQTQDSLIQQASNSQWFTQIASENLGIVLRQILLYNSQTYVLLAQLLETQKKLLASQVMNNALLIAVNLEAENRIYSKASGRPPI